MSHQQQQQGVHMYVQTPRVNDIFHAKVYEDTGRAHDIEVRQARKPHPDTLLVFGGVAVAGLA
jgi:hypothetical protein